MMLAVEPAEHVTIVPANEVSWDDLVAIFGTADYPAYCLCQRFKVTGWLWRDTTLEERTAMLAAGAACGNPDAATTSGLVAYVDGEPAGWVAVEYGRRTQSCAPPASRGPAGTRTRGTTASGR